VGGDGIRGRRVFHQKIQATTKASQVHDIKIRSRLKAQLTKFSSELRAGLSKPLGRFVSQMLFGIQSSQDVKLSNIGRALQKEMPLIRACPVCRYFARN